MQTLKESLTEYISKNLYDNNQITITQLSQASSGWSDETFILEVQTPEYTTKGFVIRKLKKDGLMADNKEMYRQYLLLDRLSKNTNLPVPKVYVYEKNESVIGSEFFIMDKLPGRSFIPWSREGQKFLAKMAENESLKKQFVNYLAQLHLVDYKALNLEDVLTIPDKETFIDEKINALEETYYKYKVVDDPIVIDALEWMKQNKPKSIPLRLVHNDYRTGNVLFDQDNITGILDWEIAEIGDPRMDIGYLCAKANRMDSPLMNYVLEREWLYDYYREVTNIDFTHEDIHFFELYHQIRFYEISLAAYYSFEKSGSTDLRMARQGYRIPLMQQMLAELLNY